MDAPDYYSLFNPQIIDSAEYHPNYFIDIAREFSPNTDDDQTPNLKEWGEYFGHSVQSNDIRKLVYGYNQNILTFLTNAVKNRKITTPDSLLGNTAIDQVFVTNNVEVFEYLAFAYQAADYAVAGVWDGEAESKKTITELIRIGTNLYKKCANNFLKIRYGYQLTRLAHISKDYEQATSFFDTYVASSKTESIIRYWALNYKAGACKWLGESAESIYNYANVFAHCKSRRAHAMQDFSQLGYVTRPTTWDSAIKLCKNADEKVNLWAMRGFTGFYVAENYSYVFSPSDWGLNTYYDSAFECLQNIAKINPASKYLEPLLGQAIQMIEYNKLNTKRLTRNGGYNSMDFYENRSSLPYAEPSALRDIVNKIKANPKTKRPYFWNYASAYLSYLMKDFKEARNELKVAESKHTTDKFLAKEIASLEAIMKLDEATSVTPELETYLLNTLTQFDIKPFSRKEEWTYNFFDRDYNPSHTWKYIMDKMSDLYDKDGNFEMSEICEPTLQLYSMMDYDTTDMLLKFISKEDKTPFQKYAATFYPAKISALYNLEGTILMGRNDFYGASVRFKKSDDSLTEKDYLTADPFFIRMRDCHDCDYDSTSKMKHLTKLEFCEKMLELEGKKDQLKPDASAEVYYQLANAYYNLTGYGNCWRALSFAEHCSLSLRQDCSKAEEYYKKAMKLTRSKEFAAKCCFMAAKCEQNTFYNLFAEFNSWDTELRQEGTKEKYRYQTNFATLTTRYSDTKFYQQAIKECGYLRRYAKK